MEYSLINNKVLDAYVQCGIRKFPIDCEKVLKTYGFKLISYSMMKKENPELYGIAKEFSDDAFQYGRTICYNDCSIKSRIRFSLMHEFGHKILGHKGNSGQQEREADYFAGEMLAPMIAVRKKECETAEDVHNAFGISYAASNKTIAFYHDRLEKGWRDYDFRLGEWLYPDSPFIHGIMVHDPKMKKSRKYVMERAEFLCAAFPERYGNIFEMTRPPEPYESMV